MASLTERMVGAAKLDAATYEEVEADTTATSQAMLVVVLANIAAGFGAFRELGFGGLLVTTLVALISWYVWAFVTYFVGTRFLPGPRTQADLGQLLRPLGFSAAPGLIRVLGIIPGLTAVVTFIAAVWMLVAMVIAVRQGLDYEGTGRAVGVCLIGLACYVIVGVVLATILGVTAGMVGR
jgi:Zn-dependent protease